MTAITAPGRYSGIPAEVYHADPCPEPSLSSSVASILLDQSPWHAWEAHPRLNPLHVGKDSSAFDLGRAGHDMLLEGGEKVAVLDFEDYRKKDAKEARDQAREAGLSPLLRAQFVAAKDMVDSARKQLARHEEGGGVFDPAHGEAEVTLACKLRGVWVRVRCDWLPNEGEIIHDLKTTSPGMANPDRWGARHMFDMGADLQAALYRRVAGEVLGWRRARFRFVVVENAPPHALSIIEPGEDVLTLADKKVDRALDLWRACLEANRWPGYPAKVCHIGLPTWQETRWLEREERDAHDPKAHLSMMMDWQAPLERGAAE